METLSDYTIVKKIGQGSLGGAYLAEHRFMKRQMLIKLLPEELGQDRQFIQRFEEEVAVLSGLDHPNIVKIHNVSSDKGRYFLVTDCVVDAQGETQNLAQYMVARGHRLEENTLFSLLKEIASALDYAHHTANPSQPILHRGLKLNNILLTHADGKLSCKLSDFGLSKIIGTGSVLSRTYKYVADAVGIKDYEGYGMPLLDEQKIQPLHASFLQNFAFLAPEQKRYLTQKPVTHKADHFAFGVLTYFLIMGEFPEALFEMPSKHVPEYFYNWDALLNQLLRQNPQDRPEALLPLLESIVPQEKKSFASMAIPAIPEHLVTLQLAEATVASGRTLKPVISRQPIDRPIFDADPALSIQVDATVKPYSPEKKVVNIEPLTTEMSILEGGIYYRGSNVGNRDEMPRHQVKLSPFAIDIHPVTNEQFVRFLEVMGGEKDRHHHDIIRLKDSRIKRVAGRLTIESGYAKHPVVGVTWYGALVYARWVGKRLPTEAEWEVACKGGDDDAIYPTGDNIEKPLANFFSSDTTPVMSYPPNLVGIYDMAGNIYEWCQDWYGYNYYELSSVEPENPKGPLQGVYRVLRGGCWKSLKEDLSCSRRHRNNPGTVNGTYGFRCAADVQ